jgi:hypothetical protein
MRSALSKSMREPGPELNPKVPIETLVAALLEPLGRKQRQELLGLSVCGERRSDEEHGEWRPSRRSASRLGSP